MLAVPIPDPAAAVGIPSADGVSAAGSATDPLAGEFAAAFAGILAAASPQATATPAEDASADVTAAVDEDADGDAAGVGGEAIA